jgi:hypothetical protein
LRSVWAAGKDRGFVIGTPSKSGGDKSIGTLVNELYSLIIAYFKQETVVPIKSLGRYLAYGIAGAMAMALGGGLLSLAAVRLVQAETGHHLRGSLTWTTYVGGFIVAGVGAGWAASRIGKVGTRK